MLRRQQERRTPRVWTLIWGPFSTELPFTRTIPPKWRGGSHDPQGNRARKTCFWHSRLIKPGILDILGKQWSCRAAMQILRCEPGRKKLRQPIKPYLLCGKLCLVLLTKYGSYPRLHCAYLLVEHCI